MAPDYAWWHGFYELKKRCMAIEGQAEQLIQNNKPAKRFDVRGAGGSTSKPKLESSLDNIEKGAR
jgi:hypothetical protein